MHEERRVKLSTKEMLEVGAILVAIALGWGVLTTRVNALEEQVKPLGTMRTDVELVKSSLMDIKEGLRDIRAELRRQRR